MKQAAGITTLIKSWPLRTGSFWCSLWQNGNTWSPLLLQTEVQWASRRKTLVELNCKLHELFFMDYHFYLKEQLTNCGGLFWLGYLAVIFSKMNKVRLFLQGKQPTVFIANDKIWAFKHFGELYNCHCELDSFPNLKTFLMR